MRPSSLSEVIGQETLVGPQGFLTSSVAKKAPVSMILFGPPGTGKTTIAEAYARDMKIHYEKINAVTTDKAHIQGAIEDAKLFGHAIVIVDEIHRLDKAKQDLLLPYVEDGTFFLIGATTTNPYISLNFSKRRRQKVRQEEYLKSNSLKPGAFPPRNEVKINPEHRLKYQEILLPLLINLEKGFYDPASIRL